MNTMFTRYNPWWDNDWDQKFHRRDRFLNQMRNYFESKSIVFLTGLRRVGKTSLMKLFIQELIEKNKIPPKHIFYLSLDDYQLKDKSLLDMIEEYRKMHSIPFAEKIYLFLDETTYQKDFELQLKNLYDSQNVKIYGSSSSASFLRNKKAYLTGRNFVLEILPLNFEEYLDFKGINIPPADEHLREKYFEDFLQQGGMPEYVLTGDVKYLKELVDDIIAKDIASLYNVRNTQKLKDLWLLLMERAGKIVSINKLANIMDMSTDTARRYLRMFEETYLIYLVPRCGKTNEKVLAPKKLYAADLGIRTFFTGFRDKGSLFENYIYLQIKQNHPCYVYEKGIEIDFCTQDKHLIEVKYNSELTDKQKKLFESWPADKKILIESPKDLAKIQQN
ncbi:MAG: ATPase [Parcubacteria group bacterium Gr01-1014_18]|nr:MAG: ATPase [Parcubacteria group bacterium Greene0416_36]TSC81513.1 MAG: ATPase [Parcubacteria group bacterium Gr01-1014_18]TSC99676.1 MAG: ATPase [Parcubacteria group bacterium Greene1014_20]TSD07127.1 MAG: ATPase [Parcubacteria group bacterium Greene0714_2]